MTMGEAIRRGLKKRCPNCGQGKVFRSYFKLNESCSVCGFRFEREPGYWVGALSVNIAFCEIWYFLLFVGTVIVTAPDVEWQWLLIFGLLTNAILPFVLLPYSRTLWLSLHLYFDPQHVTENVSA
jgi:uncharacterized protein (DUF983 family)